MKRRHEMPFGAQLNDDGTVRFRLWAPKAGSVGLRLPDFPSHDLAMTPRDGGWFEIVTGEARSGSKYQFVVDGDQSVPDPASRYQPEGVHGASEVVDPSAFEWRDAEWRGRPWCEAVIYELHIGTFSSAGTYAGAETKLDYLAELGVTAVELMPLASFPGERNWGYDGVLPYAPATPYGRPEDLKRFIDSAHARNLMVLLDVVYNHFGPEGNYLWCYAPQFFSDRHHTPWGQAINFDGPASRTVRDFFIHNALYWLEEYHFDGLRFDAVHAIVDDSQPDILTELASAIRSSFPVERQIHLVLENDCNHARYLSPGGQECPPHTVLYDAQWNDDVHHALHVLLTGENDGFYADYSENAAWHLGRSLAEGFSYQGEGSRFRNGQSRGESCCRLPLTCFVTFLQNHDQVGNRAFGERMTALVDPAAVKAAMAVLLLAPSPPLIFMGEEFGAATPFLFFCDFGADLAAKVKDGRRAEFAGFEHFNSRASQAQMPDPNSEETFLRSKIDWTSVGEAPHREWLKFYRELLAYRRTAIVPRIDDIGVGRCEYRLIGSHAIYVSWPFVQGGGFELVANLGSTSVELMKSPRGQLLYATAGSQELAQVLPFSAAWFLAE
jgi:maltooligosyltrehalose trehalohydrolase